MNKATTPLSYHESMKQMGKVLWCMVATIAYANPKDGPLFLPSVTLKIGFGIWLFPMTMPGTFATCCQDQTMITQLN